MKHLLFLIALFATATAHSQCSEFDGLLQKGDNYLKGNKPNYQEAINAYTAAILACSERAGEAKQRIGKMVSDINKLKENAVEAEKEAREAQLEAAAQREKAQTAYQKLKKTNEDFVRRFLQNAQVDISDFRYEDALEKIKTADALGVLMQEVLQAYLENADSSLQHGQCQMALENIRTASTLNILKPEALGESYMIIANGSILNLEYEVALECVQSTAALGVLNQDAIKTFLEIAFWHGESGNIRRAAVLLDSIAGYAKKTIEPSLLVNLPTDTTAARARLQEAMKVIDADYFDFLYHQKYYPDLVSVQGGKFKMGGNEIRGEDEDGNTLHWYETLYEREVSSFHIARTETTVWQFALFCAATRWDRHLNSLFRKFKFSDTGDKAIKNVSWYDALHYANWVSRQKGQEVTMTNDEEGKYTVKVFSRKLDTTVKVNLRAGYRLPTEAEWEYAARGGNRPDETIYSGSNDLDSIGWNRGSSFNLFDLRSHTVGKKHANALGLFDMSGNVSEWCWDWYDNYNPNAGKDYMGPEIGSDRVIRGGDMWAPPEHCRVASRSKFDPDRRDDLIGFRLVFVP